MRRTPEVDSGQDGRMIEEALCFALDRATAAPCPPQLAAALRYAVFPGGARFRPRLCLAVTRSCGDEVSELAVAAATAIELYHCASLALDDLPCFDNAALRRGRPALHRVFGDATTTLVGIGLLTLAGECVTAAVTSHPTRRADIQRRLLAAIGPRDGLVAGQAWEAEPHIDLARYHDCKTASLFDVAATCGAIAAGSRDRCWSLVGQRLGRAYQIADDIADVRGDSHVLGKPVSQDGGRRPNLAAEVGYVAAHHELRRLLADAIREVPACRGRRAFQRWLSAAAQPLARKRTWPGRRAAAPCSDLETVPAGWRELRKEEDQDASNSKA